MTGRVLTNHAPEKKEVAHKVCQGLKAQDIRCWIPPRDMPSGQPWAASLVAAFDDASAPLSEHSNQSDLVMHELFYVKDQGKPILPLKLGPMTLKPEVTFWLTRWHWLNLTFMSLETALNKVAKALCHPEVTPLLPAPEPHAGAPVERDDLSQRPTSVIVLEASRHEHAERLQLTLLNRATRSTGVLDADTWREVHTQGAKLFAQLLTPTRWRRLKPSTADDLLLCLDDTFVHLPWKLLFDGATFLWRRFSIGHSVRTAQPMAKRLPHQPQHTLKILVVAAPQGNLPAAWQEGKTLQRALATEGHHFQVDLRCSSVPVTAVTGALAQRAVLHDTGHAAYAADRVGQSSWFMTDSKLTGAQSGQVGKHLSMPALVICNAYESGQTTAWHIEPAVGYVIYVLAKAFLVPGSQPYTGTLSDIPDAPRALFAIEFSRALACGTTIGKALRHARQRLITRSPTESAVWTSYALCSDPTSHYLETVSEPSSIPAPSIPAASVVTPPETALVCHPVDFLEVTSVEETRFFRAKVLQQTVAFGPGWKVKAQ